MFDGIKVSTGQCSKSVNSSHPGKNGRHFVDDIFKCIFLNEKFCVLIRILSKFVPKGLIENSERWFR